MNRVFSFSVCRIVSHLWINCSHALLQKKNNLFGIGNALNLLFNCKVEAKHYESIRIFERAMITNHTQKNTLNNDRECFFCVLKWRNEGLCENHAHFFLFFRRRTGDFSINKFHLMCGIRTFTASNVYAKCAKCAIGFLHLVELPFWHYSGPVWN